MPEVLLLDEMFPPTLAETLTSAGCDTKAVSADPGMRGMADAEVLEAADREGRVLVTANIADFAQLGSQWLAKGRAHPGIVLVSTKTFPMVKARIGLLAVALLERHEEDRWPPPGQQEFLAAGR